MRRNKKRPYMPPQPDRVVNTEARKTRPPRFRANHRIFPVRNGAPHLFTGSKGVLRDHAMTHLIYSLRSAQEDLQIQKINK